MLTREELETLINSIKEKLDETTSALLTEDFLRLVTSYNLALTDIEEKASEIEKLSKDNEELLKVNGKLFQQIGFDKVEEKEENPIESEPEEEITIDEVIDEKGELI